MIAITAQYFEERRGLAMSLSTVGSSVGTIIVSPFLSYAVDQYGFFGCMLASSALMSHCAISASLFRSPIAHTTTRLVKQSENKLQVFVLTGVDKEVNSTDQTMNYILHNEDSIQTKWHFRMSRMMKVLKNRIFLLHCLKMIALPHGMNCVLLFLPSLCLEKGYLKTHSELLISLSGFCDGIGRIFMGLIFDLPTMRNKVNFLHCFLGMLVGLVIILFPLVPTYSMMLVITIVYGCVMGGYHGHRATVLVEIVDEKSQADAIGWITFSQGIGLFIAPTVSGRIVSHNLHLLL